MKPHGTFLVEKFASRLEKREQMGYIIDVNK